MWPMWGRGTGGGWRLGVWQLSIGVSLPKKIWPAKRIVFWRAESMESYAGPQIYRVFLTCHNMGDLYGVAAKGLAQEMEKWAERDIIPFPS